MHMNVSVDLEKGTLFTLQAFIEKGERDGILFDPNNRQKPDCHPNIINRFHNLN